MRVRIHHEGTAILIWGALILVIINALVWLVLRNTIAVPVTLTLISAITYLLAVNFFRSPRRKFEGIRENVVVASVDGEVVALEEVYEPEILKQNCIQLSIFMTIFNVHANWFPVDGTVIYV